MAADFAVNLRAGRRFGGRIEMEPVRRFERGRNVSMPGKHGLNLRIVLAQPLLSAKVADERTADLPGISRYFLEL